MNLINRRQFEKKVKKFLQKDKAKAEGLLTSSATVGMSNAGDINQSKVFNIQDENVNTSESLLNKTPRLSQLALPTSDE